VRNNAECLHGRGGIARKRIRELEDSIGRSKGGIRVAVTKAAPAYDVGSDVLMNEWSIAHARASQVCYCRKDFVLNVDQIAGVLRDIARIRNNHGNRLADISRLLDGDWVVSQRALDDARHRPDQIPDIRSSDDAPNARQFPRPREINSPDARVRMGRT